LPFTINAGQSVQAGVTFAPASGSPGAASGTVTFASSMNNVAPTLSGVGASNVALAWTASTTPGVTYSVYRCSTSATACVQTQPANFTRIANGVSVLSYADASVTSGQTYYYALTAIDGSGAESMLSGVSAAATIP
jgi:fibronectin type 3 domain-containing protein